MTYEQRLAQVGARLDALLRDHAALMYERCTNVEFAKRRRAIEAAEHSIENDLMDARVVAFRIISHDCQLKERSATQCELCGARAPQSARREK